MAIFTRRVLQRCLDENARFATADQLRRWVKCLNSTQNDYLSWEWEVVLLNAFAKHGKVMHEPPLGASRLDLVFESPGGQIKFAADITTISDAPLHKRNPIDRFSEELNSKVLRAGVETGRFILQVGEEQPVPHKGSRRQRKLLLPPIEEFATEVFNANFDAFIDAVKASPQELRNHSVEKSSPPIRILIQYQPGKGTGACSSSYGAYTSTTVRNKNPLYNGLKNKIDQMGKCGYEGIRGLIVCDGDSRIFTEMPNWSTYTMQEIIADFFSRNHSVDFVMTIGIETETAALGGRLERRFDPKLFVRDIGAVWAQELDPLLGRVVSSLPAIYQTPVNAISSHKWNQSSKTTKPYLGGSRMTIGGSKTTRSTIQISSRELLDLLAGHLNQKPFARNHAVMHGGDNIFSLLRAQGKMITGVSLERRPDDDDDWITFDFVQGDPAVSDFKLPVTPDTKISQIKP